MLRRYEIQTNERAFLYREGAFLEYLEPGVHWRTGTRLRCVRTPLEPIVLDVPELDAIIDSGQLGSDAIQLRLGDGERALVWRDDRLVAMLGPGTHAVWNVPRPVTVDRVDATAVRFDSDRLSLILESPAATPLLRMVTVPARQVGLTYVDGQLREQLGPGRYAFWRDVAEVDVERVDLRERSVDVAGQEIMTADRVSLRLNALLAYRIIDPETAVGAVDDHAAAVYRLAQLALREVVGSRTLEQLLSEKDGVSRALRETVAVPLSQLGAEVVRVGIRDVILPGDMRALLNRVSEAKATAEAALITRREETAAMRSAANTAKLMETNPTLMRLRELEVMEKVIEKATLQVIVGESGLTNRLMKLL
jgi:regulator of protease activity HflC (stomatin/prohibitin superfamily)